MSAVREYNKYKREIRQARLENYEVDPRAVAESGAALEKKRKEAARKIKKMWKPGMSVPKLADKVGMSDSFVYRVLREMRNGEKASGSGLEADGTADS